LKPSKALDEAVLRTRFPRTYQYFEEFREELFSRTHYKAHFKAQGAPYYSMYNVGPYTFAPYKVVWSELAHNVEAAVVSFQRTDYLGEKVIVPDHTVVAISFDDEEEAHYVCAMLNSSPSQFIVTGYVVLHPSPHILKNIKIPKYEPKDRLHEDLTHLSKQCHEKVAVGITVSDLEDQIDELTAEVWSLSKEEVKDIKDSLEEMR
jgi:hypothetical protein